MDVDSQPTVVQLEGGSVHNLRAAIVTPNLRAQSVLFSLPYPSHHGWRNTENRSAEEESKAQKEERFIILVFGIFRLFRQLFRRPGCEGVGKNFSESTLAG